MAAITAFVRRCSLLSPGRYTPWSRKAACSGWICGMGTAYLRRLGHPPLKMCLLSSLLWANGRMGHMQLTIRLLRETDDRWIADISELPGVTVYGATPEEATLKAKALALRVIAEEIEPGEIKPAADTLQFSVAT